MGSGPLSANCTPSGCDYTSSSSTAIVTIRWGRTYLQGGLVEAEEGGSAHERVQAAGGVHVEVGVARDERWPLLPVVERSMRRSEFDRTLSWKATTAPVSLAP